MDRTALRNQISEPYAPDVNGAAPAPPFAPMGSRPWAGNYQPWQAQTPALLRPSDGAPVTGQADADYGVCRGDHGQGDAADDLNTNQAANRGVFGFRAWRGLRDLRDGTAGTIVVGEIGRSDGTARLIGRVGRLPAYGPGIFTNPQADCCTKSAPAAPPRGPPERRRHERLTLPN